LGGGGEAQLTGRFRSLRFDYSSPGPVRRRVVMETTPRRLDHAGWASLAGLGMALAPGGI